MSCNKTHQNNKKYKAICVLHQNTNKVSGTIKFSQSKKYKRVKVTYHIKGLSDGLHGFHVHEYGDLTDGCSSSCAHFNPYNKLHGGRNSKIRHVGDLGNILSKDKVAKGVFYDNLISLNPKSKCSIIGRCIVVHKDIDDLGKGDNKESTNTGNAGKRLACGVIGISH